MRTLVLLIAATLAVGSAQSAELYKWVDENGVTNYTSDPPPKGRAAKPIAEDTISIYTPEAAVTDAIEAQRQRRTAPPRAAGGMVPPPGSAPPPPPAYAPPAPVPSASGAPPVVTTAPYDPCIAGGDPNCYSSTIYDSSPVFQGRSRGPVLNQPQIPPGTIAGQATGNAGVTPGLSGMTPQVAPAPAPRGNLRSRPGPPPERVF